MTPAGEMTPAAIMAAFGEGGPLPRAALEAAGQCREAMVPLFLGHIDGLIADLDTRSDDPAFIFIYHLLAEWRETRAYRPLMRLLRSDPVLIDELMDDGITECGARVVMAVFDGDPQPILDAALDEGAEEFVRGQMIDALAMLALDHAPLRPGVEDFVRRFPDEVNARTPDIVWQSWTDAVAALGLADMTPAVRRTYEDGLINPLVSNFREFEKDLAATLASGRPRWIDRRRPITDTIAELSTWHCFSEEYLKRQAETDRLAADRAFDDPDTFYPAAGAYLGPGEPPFLRPEPKVGRNDPCPCGSGRKFKKCCLQ